MKNLPLLAVDGGLVEDPFLPEEPREIIKKGAWNKVTLLMVPKLLNTFVSRYP